MSSAFDNEPVICVAWSKKIEYFAAGTLTGNIRVWNSSTGMRVGGMFGVGHKRLHCQMMDSALLQAWSMGFSSGRRWSKRQR